MVDVNKLHGKVVQNKYNWTTFAKALMLTEQRYTEN